MRPVPEIYAILDGEQSIMGEAKRRKQTMGETYGQVPPVLKEGSQQLNDHLEKFAIALSEKMDEMGADLDIGELEGTDAIEAIENELTPEEAQVKSQEIENWIQQYLTPYRPQDREKLVMGLLDPIYEDLYEAARESGQQDSESEEVDDFMLCVMHGLSTFSMVQSFLSKPNRERYAEPMRSLYSMMADDLEEAESDQLENLRSLFQPCLDDEL